jgi:N-acetyl-beta-hexosaminidase
VADRQPCLVPFCRRTCRLRDGVTADRAHPWICGDHWRRVPKRLKRRRQRIYRIWKKGAERTDVKSRRLEYRARVLYWRMWDKIAAQAIEISAGITSGKGTTGPRLRGRSRPR